MPSRSKIVSSHDMHFTDIIEDILRQAYENEVFNRKSKFRPVKTGRYKKSPVQSGNAAVACLLQYIIYESILRRSYYSQTQDSEKAYELKPWEIYCFLNKTAGSNSELRGFHDEITLVRDIVAHAYLFEGYITFNNNHQITGIKEAAIGGQKRQDLKRRLTRSLRLCTSPNQIGFREVSIVYQATHVLLKCAGLDLPYSLWKWEPTGEEIEPDEWLKYAMNSLHFGTSTIWKRLTTLIEDAEYEEFMGKLP